ncbi:hypothetical protein C1646_710176, partial [Rhizophagus diaphanus]
QLLYILKICILTLNVNIFRFNNPIRKLFFVHIDQIKGFLYLEQELSNKPKIIKNGSVDLNTFAFKDGNTNFDIKKLFLLFENIYYDTILHMIFL